MTAPISFTYGEIYRMSNDTLADIIAVGVAYTDGTLEEVGNEIDRRKRGE